MLRIEGCAASSVYFDSSAVSRWSDCVYPELVAKGIRATQTVICMSDENFGEISNTGHSGGNPARMRHLYYPLSLVADRISALPTARDVVLSDNPIKINGQHLLPKENLFRDILTGLRTWPQDKLDANSDLLLSQNEQFLNQAKDWVMTCLGDVRAEALSDVIKYSSSKTLVRYYKTNLRRAFQHATTRFPIGRRVNRRVLGIIWIIRAWMLRELARLGHYGKNKIAKIPGGQDIKQAIYLPYVDAFITNDEGLEWLLKELRFWARLGPKWIGSYERFQASVILQSHLDNNEHPT